MYQYKYISKFFSSSIKKNKLFTISIIGRPNVGKSTLVNALAGRSISLVDSLPGLTRDRKEVEIEFIDTKVKLVDTAGVHALDETVAYKPNVSKHYRKKEGTDLKDQYRDLNEESNERLAKLAITQTRNALIYSDLAIFMIDGRKGMKEEDIQIANWLEERIKREKLMSNNIEQTEEINNENNIENEINKAEDKITDTDQEVEADFFNRIKNYKKKEEIKIPEILFVANKIEDSYIPYEIYNSLLPSFLNYPLFISAKEGDGMGDLYQEIHKRIPDIYKFNLQEIQKKRVERFIAYKERLRNEFHEFLLSINERAIKEKKQFYKKHNLPGEEMIDDNENVIKYNLKTWEKDFDYYNNSNVEDNSDYDSDNDIDPLENLIERHKFSIASHLEKNKQLMESESKNNEDGNEDKENNKYDGKNKLISLLAQHSKKDSKISTLNDGNIKQFKKPIKVAIVGKTNVGKSSIINSLLKENRLIVSDVPGTTRDSIPIEWVYKGRRVELIDTAGLTPGNMDKENLKIEKVISEKTINSIKNSHLVIYVFDSMHALSSFDLKMLNFIGNEGRGVVLVSNKWDLVPNGYKIKAKSWISNQIETHCTEFKSPKIIFASVKNNFKIDSIIDEALKTYLAWNTRIPTKMLNSFSIQLSKIARRPNLDGEYLNMKFMTQVKVRPPCFVLFLNDIDLFFNAHEMYVKKMISKEFGLTNIPMRFILRDREVQSSTINFKNKNNVGRSFKAKSATEATIEKKISIQKEKMGNVTKVRRSKGAEMMFGRYNPKSIRKFKSY